MPSEGPKQKHNPLVCGIDWEDSCELCRELSYRHRHQSMLTTTCQQPGELPAILCEACTFSQRWLEALGTVLIQNPDLFAPIVSWLNRQAKRTH